MGPYSPLLLAPPSGPLPNVSNLLLQLLFLHDAQNAMIQPEMQNNNNNNKSSTQGNRPIF